MQKQHATNTSAVGLDQVSTDSRCKLAIVLMNGMLHYNFSHN